MTRDTGLEGATVVVTGAARGQGEAEARLLAELGARVIATDVRDPAAGAHAGIEFRHLDITDESEWASLAADLRSTLAGVPLRGLINNAGSHPPRRHRSDRAGRLGSRDRRQPDRADARDARARAAHGLRARRS